MSRPAVVRVAAEMAAKWNVTVRLEGDTIVFIPKGEQTDDDFDLVRMKRK